MLSLSMTVTSLERGFSSLIFIDSSRLSIRVVLITMLLLSLACVLFVGGEGQREQVHWVQHRVALDVPLHLDDLSDPQLALPSQFPPLLLLVPDLVVADAVLGVERSVVLVGGVPVLDLEEEAEDEQDALDQGPEDLPLQLAKLEVLQNDYLSHQLLQTR